MSTVGGGTRPRQAAFWPPAGAGIVGDVATAGRRHAPAAPAAPVVPAVAAAVEDQWTRVERDRAALLGLALPDAPAGRTGRRAWWWQLGPARQG